MEEADIAIIGAGCCGATAAYRLSELINTKNDVKVVVFDAAKRSGGWMNDAKFNMPIFSQVKDGMYPKIGIYHKSQISPMEWFEHMQYALNLLSVFAPKHANGRAKIMYHPADTKAVSELERIVKNKGARLVEADIYHLGNEGGRTFTLNLYKHLSDVAGVDMRTNTRVKRVDLKGKKVITYISPESGIEKELVTEHLVLAPGRDGVDLVQQILNEHHIQSDYHPAQLGYRLETRGELYPITELLYDPKIYLDKNVRTFCTNPGGFVQREKNARICNGSANRDYKSDNTNLALIHSIDSPYRGMNNHDLCNLFIDTILQNGSGKIVAQRVGDFMQRGGYDCCKENSILPVTPTMNTRHFVWGDLWTGFSGFIAERIASAMVQLNSIVSDTETSILNKDNILYGPEIKNCLLNIRTDRNYEISTHPGFYCGGDGVGTSRGINGASAIGKIIAESISLNYGR
jgi:uncharacterized protein